jgi:hypothetical protein
MSLTLLVLILPGPTSSTGPSSSSQYEGFKAPIISFHHGEFFNELPRPVLKVCYELVILSLYMLLTFEFVFLSCFFVLQANVGEALG